MKKLFYFLIVMAVAISSCKKDKAPDNTTKLNQDQLTEYSASAEPVSTEILTFFSLQLSVALDSGAIITNPPESSGKSAKSAIPNAKVLKEVQLYDWVGPDADGWYTKTYNSLGYTYTESYKAKDSTVWYKFDIEYHGGDGDYSNETVTTYTRYHKGHQILYLGDSDWKIHTFGDNDISDLEYDFKFNDWDPNTGAGVYDWYWGCTSLGGDPVPYHRYLNIISTDIGGNPPMLHNKITWYDDGGVEVGSWEFDTYWYTVDMPTIPSMD